MTKKYYKLTRALIIISSSVIVLLVILLYIKNIYLKKQYRKISKIDIINNQEEVSIGSSFKIVKNPKVGKWDIEKGKKKASLEIELIFGEIEGDTNKTFYHIGSVISDDIGDIYVCEVLDGRIKKFNNNGDYILTIGNKGAGPGELILPAIMAFDQSGCLNVLSFGNQRLTKFTKEGQYISSFNMPMSYKGCKGFIIDNSNNIYLSTFDDESEKVIHKFNSSGEYMLSFGEPIYLSISKKIELIKRYLKSDLSQGTLAISSKNELFYSQKNPYEIRKYNLNGKLLLKIFRENDFMSPPEIKLDGDKVQYKLPVHSVFIGTWKDKIINVVWIPGFDQSTDKMIFDIFDYEGQLLTTLRLNKNIWPTYINNQGQLFGHLEDDNGIQKVVRFKLNF